MSEIDVSVYLKKFGPASSKSILAWLSQQKLSPDASRQRLSRAKGVERLSGIVFPNGGKFFYLEKQFGSDLFYQNLIAELLAENSSFGIAYAAIRGRGGVLPLSLFDTFSGAPSRMKGRVPSQRILKELVNVGLLQKRDGESLGEILMTRHLEKHWESAIVRLRAEIRAEQLMIMALKEWLRKIGFVGFGSVQTRGEAFARGFGAFTWDLTAPSYVNPFCGWSKKGEILNGFVVADVIWNANPLNFDNVRFFLNKFDTMRAGAKTRPFLAILLTSGFEPAAFKILKGKGVLATTVSNVLGEDTATALRELVSLLQDAAKAILVSPDRLESFFNSLSRIEGASLNLRGDLFEVMTAYAIKAMQGGFVDFRKIILDPNDGKQAEIDVVSSSNNRSVIIEAKGIKSSKEILVGEVETWLEKKVPRIRNYLLNNAFYENHEMEFSFWTTGLFEKEALAYLEARAAKIKKYKVTWNDGIELTKLFQNNGLGRLNKIIEQHYNQ